MIKEIKEAYEKIINEYYSTRMVTTSPDMVLRVSPDGFSELMHETLYRDSYGNLWLDIFCARLLIILENTMPENVNFVIQLKEDYRDQAHRELDEKLSKMFSVYRW